MTRAIMVVLIAATAACEGGNCMEVDQQGPGLTGTASYTIGDGSRFDELLGWAHPGDDSVTLGGSFEDEWGRDRSYELHVQTLAVGTFDLADRGDFCLRRQAGGATICSPLTGTIEVRALSADCYWHESGVGSCAHTADLTLHARSEWETTLFVADAELLTVGSWVETECVD